MPNKRRGFPTYKAAKKFLEIQRITHSAKTKDWNIYDMKKTYPRRTTTRYFVGDYYEWLGE